ncbi:hypothetical protein BC828DRAFT_132277 [Blastocladiella britannica]|nr:hypothetical protein BC828DRAFT_132277 [Blastocladiella britannica]
MPPRQSPPRQAYPDLHDSEYPDPKRPRTSASLSLAHRQHSHQQQAAPTSGTSPLAVRFGSGSPPPVTLHHLHHPHSANGATALPTPDLKEQVAWLSAAAARLSSLVVAALPRDSPHAAEAEDIEHELACIRDALHPLPPPIAAGAGPYSPHPVYPSPVQYHPPPMTTTKATTGRMNGSPSLPPPPLQTTSHSQYHHHLPHPHATSALPLPSAIRRQCHPYQHHQHAPFGSAHTNGGSPPTPISVTTVSVPATAATLRASMSSPAPGHQYHHFRHQQHHSAPPAWPPATATPPESSTPEVSLPPPQTQSGRMYKRSYRPWEEDEDAALPERLSGEDEQQQNVHMYRAPPPLRTRPNMADVLPHMKRLQNCPSCSVHRANLHVPLLGSFHTIVVVLGIHFSQAKQPPGYKYRRPAVPPIVQNRYPLPLSIPHFSLIQFLNVPCSQRTCLCRVFARSGPGARRSCRL